MLGTPPFGVRSSDQACIKYAKGWLSTLETVPDTACASLVERSSSVVVTLSTSKLGQVCLPHIASRFQKT